MAATLLKLSDLAVGASATVREFPAQDPAFIRLREMGLLAGTRRAELLALGKLNEAVIRVKDLKKNDRILLINSVRGIIETSLWDK